MHLNQNNNGQNTCGQASGQPFRVLHPDGYIDVSRAPVFYYHIKDHLGNVRAVIQASPGSISGTLVQATDYYPFGMAYTIDFSIHRHENQLKMLRIDERAVEDDSPTLTRNNPYLYNGKEEQPMPGKWLDCGARFYDAQLGRWHTIDPLIEAQEAFSPYHFSYNNPLLYNDPTGLIGENFNQNLSTWVHDNKNDRWLWIEDGYYFTFVVSPEEFDAIKKAGNIKDAGGAVYNRWFWRAVLEELRGNPGKDEVDKFIQDWYIGIWADAAIGIYDGNVTDAALKIGAGKLKQLKKLARWVRMDKNVTSKIPGTAKGGQIFENNKGKLPKKDKDGKPITYREYDVNPAPQHGSTRGQERMVVGSDGRAYYTKDHYKTFEEIKY